MAGRIKAWHVSAVGNLRELVGVQKRLDPGRHRARVGVGHLQPRQTIVMAMAGMRSDWSIRLMHHNWKVTVCGWVGA